jgi:hypothetical protein
MQAMISRCEKTLAEIRADPKSVKAHIDRIGRLKLRVTEITSSVGQLRAQIIAQIQSMADCYSELVNSLDKNGLRFETEMRGSRRKIASPGRS